MSRHLERLRSGERWWAAEFVLRSLGLVLLRGCYKLALLAHRMTTTPPPHQATLGELAICAATFLALTGGLALTFFGAGLFQDVPIPPHSRLVLEGPPNA